MSKCLSFLLTALALPLVAEISSAQVIGVTWIGEVVIVDPATGDGGVVGHSGVLKVNAMAKSSTGRLLVATTAPQARLIEIDPETFTGYHAYFTYLDSVRGLTCSPSSDDLLYAIDAQFAGAENYLYTLDLSVPSGGSVIKTLIGQTDIAAIQALVFAPNGVLLAWSAWYGLLTIDPGTAATENVNGLPDGTSEIQTLFFDEAGTLFGIHENIYTIDLSTGAYTLVAEGDFGSVRGAELYPGLCAAYNYCALAPNSAGPGASIAMAGSMSITDNDLTLIASGCPPGQFGLFFYNQGQIQVPFGDGWLCVGSGAPGLFRLGPPVHTNAQGVAARQVDFLLPPVSSGAGAIHPASSWNFQFYFRDPAGPGGSGFNTSNALNVTFCR